MEENMTQVSPLRSFDKVLFWMGMPFLLVLLGAVILNQEEDALKTFCLFVGHSFLLLVMRSEKKRRLKDEKNQTQNFFAWLIFGFGLGYFLWSGIIGAIVGLIVAILAIRWKLTTNSISFLLWTGWILNMFVSFTSPYSLIDQFIYLFSPNIWQTNATKLAVVTLVFMLVLAFTVFRTAAAGAQNSEAYQAKKRLEKINAHNRKIHEQQQQQKPQKQEKLSRISRKISDQEAINNIHKGLAKVERLINMNLTSDAATNLRQVSELFTKQISIQNRLSLEKMDQFSRVKVLYAQKYISEELYNLLSTIRKLGNTAVHEFGDDDRFNKNGLLKLRRQFLEHLREWGLNNQNEVATTVENESNPIDFEPRYDYKFEFEEKDDEDEIIENSIGQDDADETVDESVDQDDDNETVDESIDQDDDDETIDESIDQDDDDGVEDESNKNPQRYSVSMVLSKEKREKMKF
ncbi:MAG: DUF4145 domain-containing protein [Bacillota bacterium]